MSNELLDFVDRDNFDFFRFSVLMKNEERKDTFKRKCEKVLELAHATVQDMCLLGYHLKELKNSGTWESVWDPTSGYTFGGGTGTFQDFCEYAFGFSKTRTSNLLRIAEFVVISGGKAGFIDARYTGYNTSQLVELAAVPEYNRKYFSADMTVKDMRAAKEYMKMGSFWTDKYDSNFDLKRYTEIYKQVVTPATKATPAPTQLPGQTSFLDEELHAPLDDPEPIVEERIEPLEDVTDWAEQNPTSDFAPSVEELAEQEDVQPLLTTEEDDFDTWLEKQPEGTCVQTHSYDEESDVEDPTSDFSDDDCADETPASKYNFQTRDGFRIFYRDYRNWESVFSGHLFEKIYKYRFKNGMEILAVETITCEDMAIMSRKEYKVRYYWATNIATAPLEVSTLQMEQYLPMIRDEL